MTYRRHLRIGGELISSPRFTNKKDADDWYHQQRRKKQFLRDGLIMPDSDDGIIFIDYARIWIKNRMAKYPKGTWMSDEQRLRDYILPIMSEMPIGSITGAQIRSLLLKISEPGFLKEGFTISTTTRTRVKALLSVIFSDALNEDPPFVKFNPVLGIRIKDRRMGKKKPRVIPDTEGCINFLSKAKELGPLHYAVASTFLMSGLRKQELIALRWTSLNSKKRELLVSEKLEQASNSIKPGTKGGENVTRIVPIPKLLVSILGTYRETLGDINASSYMFQKENGRFYGPREIWALVNSIAKASRLDVTPHALRHSYGRTFAMNTGNLKALQAILGHSSSLTTDIYAELSGSRIRGFGEAVSFDIGMGEKNK